MTDGIRLAVITGVFLGGLGGWAVEGYGGAATGLVLGTAMLVAPC